MLKAFLLGYVLLTGEAVIRANCSVRLHFGGVSALFVPELPFDIAVHGISDAGHRVRHRAGLGHPLATAVRHFFLPPVALLPDIR
jgi:hypothetical protein